MRKKIIVNDKILIKWMESYVCKKKFNGCSLLIEHDNKTIFDYGAGYSDSNNTRPFNSSSIVRIFSMTKAIVSACLLALLEKEKIPTETKISTFMSNFSECHALVKSAKSIDDVKKVSSPTISQLLNHTSGLSYFFNEDLVAQEYIKRDITTAPNNFDLDITINKLSEVPFAFEPGSFWNYSVGIDVAGKIIEIISGKSLNLFLDDFLFQLLGMKDTSFYLPFKKRERFADCFFFENMTSNFHPLEKLYKDFSFSKNEVTNFSGGSGLLSTATDYSRFARLLLNNGAIGNRQIFSQNVMEKIKSNSLPSDIASMGVKSFAQMATTGMGHSLTGSVIISPNQKFPSNINDFGWGGMGSNYFWVDFERKLSTIFMTQLIPSSAYPNRKELKELLI